ncbi:HesA/MoeB/ThiF family protein [Nesterenkonia sp.]|uniref:HesA/MoeB/ThiF family protein n=1 Tax=Nesterenkonia sp. TaxID=704201 RepID=UPI002621B3DC|nr:HesA/MoeB/ThiF family protein [Nesterenkonia sp.]
MSLEKFSRTQAERFQRHFALAGFGIEAQARLLESRAVVVGAGGLGAPVLTYLAAAGVGAIDVIDHDVVDRSNLHRQVIHSESSLGKPKTASAAERMRGLHPEVKITEHRVSITAENAAELIAPADIVVDGSDNFATRYVVSDACEIAGTPLISGSILRFAGQVGMFWSAPDERHWDPAWAEAGRGPTYRDLYPEAPDAGEVPTCAEAGVIGVLPGVIGSLMAAEAVKFLAGVGEPLLGRVLTYDALTSRFREIRLAPDPAREPVRSIGADVAGLGGGPAAGDQHGATSTDHDDATTGHRATATSDEGGAAPDHDDAATPGHDDGASPDHDATTTDRDDGARPSAPAAPASEPGDVDFNPFTGQPKQPDDLSPAEFRRAVAAGQLGCILDVREPGEHQAGHVEQARNVPLGELTRSAEPPPGLDQATEDRPAVVYCAHGVRSRQAVQMLRSRWPDLPLKNLLGGYELLRQTADDAQR